MLCVAAPTQSDVCPVVDGLAGLTLYLQAYQLLLRRQCWALVHAKRLPAPLEALTKDLWSLWLPVLYAAIVSTVKKSPNEAAEAAAAPAPTPAKQYSTQAASASEDEDGEGAQEHRKENRSCPTLVDALALCYMAAMLLRVPLSVGDLCRYV